MDYEDAIEIMRAAGQMHAYHEVGEKPLLAVVDAARRKALEEAAKVCEAVAANPGSANAGKWGDWGAAARTAAKAIRALIEK